MLVRDSHLAPSGPRRKDSESPGKPSQVRGWTDQALSSPSPSRGSGPPGDGESGTDSCHDARRRELSSLSSSICHLRSERGWRASRGGTINGRRHLPVLLPLANLCYPAGRARSRAMPCHTMPCQQRSSLPPPQPTVTYAMLESSPSLITCPFIITNHLSPCLPKGCRNKRTESRASPPKPRIPNRPAIISQ
jgi:hypothetical protein